jgi:eukaryotic-like serine/threonine-protein kinase
MPTDPNKVRDLFLHAVGRLPPAEWDAFVAATCTSDSELEGQVMDLLRAHQDAGSFLDQPAGDLDVTGPFGATTAGAAARPAQDAIGTAIGPYRPVEKIGEGGFGVVYLAEQTEPVRRRVALKVLKPGMDTQQVVARFEQERQALAVMDHPNIAKVLDGGATDQGRPFFVMELVQGLPITRYCDDHRLSPAGRLELFVQACHAVQHAHQKGVIHRDIKPSNVLAASFDGRPVVKVIDFGVAKAVGQPLTEKTLVTGLGAVVGTPEYMSPEQAEMDCRDIDTRSDIYALGILLYELLTGTTPLTRQRVKEAGLLEVLRLVREEDPPRPSTRLSTTDELPSIAANRGLEPKRLSGLVRGDLDWIVMKALEKDRTRRYETANAFATDVRHYLADEPVAACPPSAGYRLRKFVRRNRGPVAAGAGFFGLVILGTVGTSVGMAWALRAEKTATGAAVAEGEQRQEAETQRDRARTAEVEARDESAVTRAVNDFLLNDLLAAAAPNDNPLDKRVTVEDLLKAAAARIPGKFEGQPRTEAAVRLTIGATYRALGKYPAALPHLERSLDLRRRVLGPRHPDTLTSMNSLAVLYQAWGRYALAVPLLTESLAAQQEILGEENPHTVASLNNLALVLQGLEQYEKAEPLFVRALDIHVRLRGEAHRDTLLAMNNLAVLHEDRDRPKEAERLYLRILEVGPTVVSEGHPCMVVAMNNLGDLYRKQGRLPEAEPHAVRAEAVGRKALGEEHPHALAAAHNLAALRRAQNRFTEAEALYIRILPATRRALGEDHPDLVATLNRLGMLYRVQGQFAKAEPYYREALEKTRNRYGVSERTANAQAVFALTLIPLGKFSEAETVLRECLTIREQKIPDDWRTAQTRSLLGGSLLGQKKYPAAEPLLVAGYAGLRDREAGMDVADRVRVTEALERLVEFGDATGQAERAAAWRKELAARRAADPKAGPK